MDDDDDDEEEEEEEDHVNIQVDEIYDYALCVYDMMIMTSALIDVGDMLSMKSSMAK